MSSPLFIQSANSLVSRVAQWVGAIPTSVGVNASGYNATTGVVSCASNPSSAVLVGDFIGASLRGPYTLVTAVSSTTITVSDPDLIWNTVDYPTAILKIPSQSSIEISNAI